MTAHTLPDIDDPSDWRQAEYRLVTERMRARLDTSTWPAWLGVQGDWFHCQMTVHGLPIGATLCWPNLLLVADWLIASGLCTDGARD